MPKSDIRATAPRESIPKKAEVAMLLKKRPLFAADLKTILAQIQAAAIAAY